MTRERLPICSGPPCAAYALLAALLLGGCARAPAPTLYLLDSPREPVPPAADAGPVIGLAPLDLPSYLDRPQIVARAGAHRIDASEQHLWAEPLARGAARVLTASLSAALGSNRVYRLPRRHPLALDWRVEIDIDRFDGALDQTVTLAARWSLFRAAERDARLTRVTHLDEAVTAPGHAGLVAAQTAALRRLGETIAAAIAAAH
ncbi:MAG: PqiC family protein [Gammaproteobacteria bacterium]